MSDNNKEFSLDKPQYNSTLKLIKKLDEFESKKNELNLPDEEIEKIHEKVKLN